MTRSQDLLRLQNSPRIHSPFDQITPEFDLIISGLSANEGTRYSNYIRSMIAGITVEKDIELTSEMRIDVINRPEFRFDTGPGGNSAVNAKAFQEGNSFLVYLGYGNHRVFKGGFEIVRWLPDFPDSGFVSNEIVGYDGRHIMQEENRKFKGKRRTRYLKTRDADIVKYVASKYGFGVEVDPALRGVKVKLKSRVQKVDQTDWEFLEKLAALNDVNLWVEYSLAKKKNIVHFRRREENNNPKYLFSYGEGAGTLLSANPDFMIKSQPTSVEVLSYDKQTRKIETTIVERATGGESMYANGGLYAPGRLNVVKKMQSGAKVRFKAFGRTIEAIASTRFESKGEAKKFIKKYLKSREDEFLLLDAVLVGTPGLEPRDVILIEGLGVRLDGLYLLTNVRDIMKPGSLYTTEIKAHKIFSDVILKKDPARPTLNEANRARYGAVDASSLVPGSLDPK